MALSAALMFESPRHVVRELAATEVPLLQALFDANPEYFLRINGRRPPADAARVEFDETPPPHLGFTKRWLGGIFARDGGALDGVAIVVADLGAPGVWHVALFLLATRLHGGGVAAEVHAALQAWAAGAGARWLRLGVVQGNARAERFWHTLGYREVRRREGVDTGGCMHTIRVLVKPLAGGSLKEYLALVPRDRPGSDLP